LLNKKGKNVGQTPADPASLSESERCQSPSKDGLATTARSDGESREGCLQRPSSLIRHWDVSTQLAKGAAGASRSSSQPQVPPKNSLPLPRISELFFVVAGQGLSSENLSVAAGRLVAREDLPAAREKDPSERTEPGRRSNTFSACRNPTLAKCGGEAQHSQSWGFGVLRDSRMFRARQHGPKHLALRRSL
jgi:hypothetical protein